MNSVEQVIFLNFGRKPKSRKVDGIVIKTKIGVYTMYCDPNRTGKFTKVFDYRNKSNASNMYVDGAKWTLDGWLAWLTRESEWKISTGGKYYL